MGEALISRAGGGTGSTEVEIPVIPGYHSVLVSVNLEDGDPLMNYPIVCKDGSQNYNYSTNNKGQVLFTCNSGSANIFVSNVNTANSTMYIDLVYSWYNVAAPIGSTSKVNINMGNHRTNLTDLTSSRKFTVSKNITANINIVGGGGGGSQGGGGAGYMNNYPNYKLIKNNVYTFTAGSGGYPPSSNSKPNGGTGGTSVVAGTNMSAIGGTGGEGSAYDGRGGKGGLGNGGMSGMRPTAGTDSPVSFAGGGGGGQSSGVGIRGGSGGSPYGGRGAWETDSGSAMHAGNGSRGGGGGGSDYWYYHTLSGVGGTGMLRIQIL